MDKKYVLDLKEKEIVRELIRNPRISDNQIAKNTGIPLKTVNTKRKKLEIKDFVKYYAELDNSKMGTGLFESTQMYIIKLKHGVTREMVVKKMNEIATNKILQKHVLVSLVGEQNGKVIVSLIIQSYKEEDLIEIYNAEIIPILTSIYERDIIDNTEVINLSFIGRLMHNYIPLVNQKNGIITPEWSNENIFVYE